MALSALPGLWLTPAAAQTTEACRAHAKQIAADFQAVETYSGAHPLDMGDTKFQQVLVGFIDGSTEEQDLARRVIISLQLSLQAGCRDLREDIQKLR
ncbi:MAG: hypothetical protein AAFR46_14745 [Pseudomonadota bacterium]